MSFKNTTILLFSIIAILLSFTLFLFMYQIEEVENPEYVKWEKEWLTTDEAKKMLQYWQNKLSNADNLLYLSTNYERLSNVSPQGRSKYFSFDKSLSERIVTFSKENTVRSFVVLLAAYATMLHKLSHQNIVTIGVPLTNRRKEKTKNVFGVFVNILPLMVEFSAQLTGKELVKQIRQTLLQAHRNQDIPFLHLVDHATLHHGRRQRLPPLLHHVDLESLPGRGNANRSQTRNGAGGQERTRAPKG